MRNPIDLLNSLSSNTEKKWDARLFIDSAVKQSVGFHLGVIANALCGPYKIRFEKATKVLFENTEYHRTDGGEYVKVTTEYQYMATFDKWVFYGNNKISVLTKIIDFWAGKETVFPCGAAHIADLTKEETN